MWYYALGEQRHGPITLEEFDAAIQRGEVRRDTYVWTEGMADWLPADQVGELADRFAAPAAVVSYAGGAHLHDVNRLNALYKWLLISWISGVVLLLACVGIVGIIAGVVLYCMILHKCWSLIPREWARTSPDLAIGLMFVPLFNMYWVFVAMHGLARDLNRLLDELGLSGPRVNETLTLSYCILIVCSWLPYLGLLAALTAVVLNLIAVYQIKNAAIAVIRSSAADAVVEAQPV